MIEDRRGVISIFQDGKYVYFDHKDVRNHDDILWRILADNQVLPDSYKRLTSLDDTFKHEKTSSGVEAMIAASNDILVTFIIYDIDTDYKYALVYLPENITGEQYDVFIKLMNEYVIGQELNVYVAGKFSSSLRYSEIDSDKYVPDFIDEQTFMDYNDLFKYVDNLCSSKSK